MTEQFFNPIFEQQLAKPIDARLIGLIDKALSGPDVVQSRYEIQKVKDWAPDSDEEWDSAETRSIAYQLDGNPKAISLIDMTVENIDKARIDKRSIIIDGAIGANDDVDVDKGHIDIDFDVTGKAKVVNYPTRGTAEPRLINDPAEQAMVMSLAETLLLRAISESKKIGPHYPGLKKR